jgi:hypothetical protein
LKPKSTLPERQEREEKMAKAIKLLTSVPKNKTIGNIIIPVSDYRSKIKSAIRLYVKEGDLENLINNYTLLGGHASFKDIDIVRNKIIKKLIILMKNASRTNRIIFNQVMTECFNLPDFCI